MDVIGGRPYLGGACANVAVGVARAGALVALAGGVGADPNGDWIASGLRAEGIVMDWFDRDPGVTTPVATVAVAQDGEPTFTFVGESLAPGVRPGRANRGGLRGVRVALRHLEHPAGERRAGRDRGGP